MSETSLLCRNGCYGILGTFGGSPRHEEGGRRRETGDKDWDDNSEDEISKMNFIRPAPTTKDPIRRVLSWWYMWLII